MANTQSKVFIPNSLIAKILDRQAFRVVEALENVKNQLRDDVGSLVSERIETSRIMKGLRNRETYGGGMRTVRGEFGLTTGAGQRAADEIINTILNSINADNFKIQTRRSARGTTIEIECIPLQETYRSDLIGNLSLSYESNGHYVDWMNWLLRGSADLNTDAGIMYLNKPKKSRSQQAVMYQKEPKPNKNGKIIIRDKATFKQRPYRLPEEFMPRGNSKDFVDEALKSPNFTRRLKTIITSAINTAIKRI